jgi:hypothetical protein
MSFSCGWLLRNKTILLFKAILLFLVVEYILLGELLFLNFLRVPKLIVHLFNIKDLLITRTNIVFTLQLFIKLLEVNLDAALGIS